MVENPVVEISDGKVQGCSSKNLDGEYFHSFFGIPYGKPPVGNLRFKVNIKLFLIINFHNLWINIPIICTFSNLRYLIDVYPLCSIYLKPTKTILNSSLIICIVCEHHKNFFRRCLLLDEKVCHEAFVFMLVISIRLLTIFLRS